MLTYFTIMLTYKKRFFTLQTSFWVNSFGESVFVKAKCFACKKIFEKKIAKTNNPFALICKRVICFCKCQGR